MSLGPTNTVFRYENGQSRIINSQTDNYTATPDDNGHVIVVTAGTGKTVTVPTNLPVGFNCLIVQGGAGQVTIAESSTTIENVAGQSKTSAQFAIVALVSISPDTFILSGSTGA